MQDHERTDEESSSVVVVTPAEGSVKGIDEGRSKDSSTNVEDSSAKVTSGEKKDEEKADGGDDDGEKEEEKIIIGVVCDSKNLYQKFDKHGRFTWTEEYPDDLEEAAENEQTLKYALLVRNKKSYDSRKKLEIDSIVIQSPYLKTVLRDVLKDYPGVTTSLARLTFAAPFRPFVHRWQQLAEAVNGDFDEVTKTHLKLLHDVLYAELKDILSATKDYIKNRVITYEHVWTIFQPGCTVYASRYGRPVAVKLDQGQFTEHCKYGPCFQLKCNRIDWDGSKFGYGVSQHIILPFADTIPVTDLDCFPLEFHPDKDSVTAGLIARGQLFERLAGYHYKAYKGVAIEQKEWGPAKITVDSRVIVDAYAHGKANPNEQANLKPLKRVDTKTNVHADDSDDDYDRYDRWNNGYDSDNDDLLFLDGEQKRLPLTSEQLVLCTPIVKGYALKTKKWLEFFVEEVTEVVFNERAFDSLVLPEGHKQLILAFAQSQVKFKDTFDDVIVGKGRGVIMLLSGGPGIGKTLTAESVAEEMRVPLYVMSAGDLGVASWDVETKLAQILEMVAKWNAVLLLDECDVFLEARSTHDLDRNRIVSIFLRTLEHYEGILFLTTNRVKDMDEAFHSRIHLSLEYPALDTQARKAVWAGFLGGNASAEKGDSTVAEAGRLSNHKLMDEDMDKLAKLEINGRQIKNVLKMAHLLACQQEKKLEFSHLRTVLTVEGYKVEA